MAKKITKDSKDALRKKLEGTNFVEQEESFITDEYEIVLADDFAYVHGRGPLHGTSTNIMSLDELPAALKRMKAAKG